MTDPEDRPLSERPAARPDPNYVSPSATNPAAASDAKGCSSCLGLLGLVFGVLLVLGLIIGALQGN